MECQLSTRSVVIEAVGIDVDVGIGVCAGGTFIRGAVSRYCGWYILQVRSTVRSIDSTEYTAEYTERTRHRVQQGKEKKSLEIYETYRNNQLEDRDITRAETMSREPRA